jgi:hypothetical protein
LIVTNVGALSWRSKTGITSIKHRGAGAHIDNAYDLSLVPTLYAADDLWIGKLLVKDDHA